MQIVDGATKEKGHDSMKKHANISQNLQPAPPKLVGKLKY